MSQELELNLSGLGSSAVMSLNPPGNATFTGYIPRTHPTGAVIKELRIEADEEVGTDDWVDWWNRICKIGPGILSRSGAAELIDTETVTIFWTQMSGTIGGHNATFSFINDSSISWGLFEGYKNLNIFEIGYNAKDSEHYVSTITEFSKNMFKDCEKLKILRQRDSSVYNKVSYYDQFWMISKIHSSAFENCKCLSETSGDWFKLNFTPKEPIYIGENAFRNCLHFNPFTQIGQEGGGYGLKSRGQIGDYAFAKTSASGVLNCNLDKISKGCYKECPQLVIVDLSNKIERIEAEAFQGCKELNGVRFSSDLKFIGPYAFAECGSLSKGSINKLDEADDGLLDLSNCKKLETIGERAFYNCTGIKKIKLPASVKYIGYDAFAGCNDLAEIWFEDNSDGTLEMGQGVFYKDTENGQALTIYTNATIGKLPIQTAALGKGCFHNSNLTGSLIIPTGKLYYVGNSLFRNCKNLEEVIFLGSTYSDNFSNSYQNNPQYNDETTKTVQFWLDSTFSHGRCLFPGCEGLKKYCGPPDFLFGHNTGEKIKEWENDVLQVIVLTTKELSDNQQQKDDGNNYINFTTTGFLKKCDALREIWFPKEDKLYLNLNDLLYKTSGDFAFQGLQIFERWEAGSTNDGSKNSYLDIWFRGKENLQIVPVQNYVDFHDRIYAKENFNGTNQSDFTYFGNNVILSSAESRPYIVNDLRRTTFVVNTSVILSDYFLEKTAAGVQNLIYLGDRIIDNDIPFTGIINLYLSSNVITINDNSFEECKNIQNIYDYDNGTAHTFSALKNISVNSFALDDIMAKEGQDFLYQDTNKGNISLKYNRKILLKQSGEKETIDLTSFTVFAKHSLVINESNIDTQTYKLPFIGNVNHWQGTKNNFDVNYDFSSLKNLFAEKKTITGFPAKLIIENPNTIIFQSDKNYGTFEGAQLTKLTIAAPFKIQAPASEDLTRLRYLFTSDSFDRAKENNTIIFQSYNTSNGHIDEIPAEFLGGWVKDGSKLNIRNIDCSGMKGSARKKFNEGCFYGITGNVILTLPHAFEVIAPKTKDRTWFDFRAKNNLKFEELRYCSSLLWFVRAKNRFGSAEQVPFQKAIVFKTIEESSDTYVAAPDQIDFTIAGNLSDIGGKKEGITLFSYSLYNNKFLNSIVFPLADGEREISIQDKALGSSIEDTALIEIVASEDQITREFGISAAEKNSIYLPLRKDSTSRKTDSQNNVYYQSTAGNWYLTKISNEDVDEKGKITIPKTLDLSLKDNTKVYYGIYSYAFCSNTLIKDLTIPKTITELRENCFQLSHLENIYLQHKTRPPLKPYTIAQLQTGNSKLNIYYPIGCQNIYSNYGWVSYKDIVVLKESDRDSIDSATIPSLYLYNQSLTSAVINSQIEDIGDMAFLGVFNQSETPAVTNFQFSDDVDNSDNYTIAHNSIIRNELDSSTILIKQGTIGDRGAAVIGQNSFYNHPNLFSSTGNTSLTFSACQQVEDFAFQNCLGISNITFTQPLNFLSPTAFYGCDNLEWITLNESDNNYCGDDTTEKKNEEVTVIYKKSGDNKIIPIWVSPSISRIDWYNLFNESQKKEIIPYLFRHHSSISGTLTIPSNITKIGRCAFEGCSGLTSLTWNNIDTTNLIEIEANAFKDCISLEGAIEIPPFVEKVGEDIFQGCSKDIELICKGDTSNWHKNWHGGRKVTWSNNGYAYLMVDGIRYTLKDGIATVIKQSSNITSANILPSITYKEQEYSVTTIDEDAFYNCKSLINVIIPDGVTNIGGSAFSGCENLTSVVIPDSVISIGYSAFEDCTSLTSLTIGDNVTSIGNYAFEDCTNLTEIKFNATAMEELSSFNYVFSRAGINREGIKVIIGKNVTKIPAHLFNPSSSSLSSPKITSVEFEEGGGCESIGTFAFAYCTSLTSVVIPDSVTSIGSGAFRECTSLVSVVIGNNVTHIITGAFYGCTRLTSIVIPISVTNIGNQAFGNCTSLTIYCEASSKPSGWNSNWNSLYRPVVWGYTSE